MLTNTKQTVEIGVDLPIYSKHVMRYVTVFNKIIVNKKGDLIILSFRVWEERNGFQTQIEKKWLNNIPEDLLGTGEYACSAREWDDVVKETRQLLTEFM